MAQATLQDIAKIAGVSAVTVHRVLTNKGSFSPKTAENIKRIAHELGYEGKSSKPSPLAGETCFKTRSIGLLLVERPREILNCTINANLLSYIGDNLARYGLLFNIIQTPDSNSLPETFSRDRLDGVILLGTPYSETLYAQIEDMNPVGLLSLAYGEHYSVDWVTSDYQARGRMAIEYFMDRGHTTVAYLNTQKNHQGLNVTGQSFQFEANAKGIRSHLFEGGDVHQRTAGQQQHQLVMDALVRQMQALPYDQRPTAVFVANDEMAVDLYKSLRDHRIEPMKAMDILSCDNDKTYLSQLSPRPATIDLNLEIIAQTVVERLLFRIRNPRAVKGILTFVPPSIIPAQEAFTK